MAAVTEEKRGQANASFEDNSEVVTFDGVPANFFTVRNFNVAEGYAFTDSDVQAYNHVAVIGSALAATLFGAGSDPVGQYIQVKNIQFRIIGVLASNGTGAFGIDQDNIVMVPISVAQTRCSASIISTTSWCRRTTNYNITFAQSTRGDRSLNRTTTSPTRTRTTLLSRPSRACSRCSATSRTS